MLEMLQPVSLVRQYCYVSVPLMRSTTEGANAHTLLDTSKLQQYSMIFVVLQNITLTAGLISKLRKQGATSAVVA